MTDVRLDSLGFYPPDVERLLEVSRDVARTYGARRWNSPLHLITDDADRIPDRLTSGQVFAGHDGMCWPVGYIWLRPKGTPTYEAQIAAHEVAHHLTYRRDRVHGAEWRRMYMRLVGLWQYTLTRTFPNYATLAREVVVRYDTTMPSVRRDPIFETAALVGHAEETWRDFHEKLPVPPHLLTVT